MPTHNTVRVPRNYDPGTPQMGLGASASEGYMNLSTFKQLQIAQTSGYVVPGFTGLGFRQGGKGGVVSLGTIYLNS